MAGLLLLLLKKVFSTAEGEVTGTSPVSWDNLL